MNADYHGGTLFQGTSAVWFSGRLFQTASNMIFILMLIHMVGLCLKECLLSGSHDGTLFKGMSGFQVACSKLPPT